MNRGQQTTPRAAPAPKPTQAYEFGTMHASVSDCRDEYDSDEARRIREHNAEWIRIYGPSV